MKLGMQVITGQLVLLDAKTGEVVDNIEVTGFDVFAIEKGMFQVNFKCTAMFDVSKMQFGAVPVEME